METIQDPELAALLAELTEQIDALVSEAAHDYAKELEVVETELRYGTHS